MAHHKVIVFGPTGNIASVAARTAQEDGAQVCLAMRDTAKPIPGLSPEQEKSGNYERVQADLMKPDTVAAAVRKSGATSAFFYLAFGSPDHMKSTIEALKSAGIEFAVFLSSYTITTDPADVPPQDIIPYVHAQVEINLAATFPPEKYVAVRPGGFATNTLMWKSGLNDGEVKAYCPHVKFDYIVPEDMGRVCGKILTTGQQNGEKHVYLLGPDLLSQSEAVSTLAKALDKNVNVKSVNEEEGVAIYTGAGFPESLSRYMIGKFNEMTEKNESLADRSYYEAGVNNIEKYSGKPATPFHEWAAANTQLFSK